MIQLLRERFPFLATRKVTLGFDGFIDTIYRLVRSKEEEEKDPLYFSSISEFGAYILEKGDKNFSLELEERMTKIGGNMPIMSNALAHLGPQLSCIGSLGLPTVHPLFGAMPGNCVLYSYANPGISVAMEFSGKKIIFAEIGKLNRVSWEELKTHIDRDTLTHLFSERTLISLQNWSELDNSTEFWKGLLRDILPYAQYSGARPLGFVDLADCSKRSADQIAEAMELLKAFSRYWDIALSLNINEAHLVYTALTGNGQEKHDLLQIGAALYQRLSLNCVMIHHAREALAWDASGLHRQASIYVEQPLLSTGAGDNFNAGYCAGRMMDLDIKTSMFLGHATAGFYMTRGKSATPEELMDFIESRLE